MWYKHPIKLLAIESNLKDRIDDQRVESEWEPIKLLLHELGLYPKSLPNTSTRTCQDDVVTTDPLTLGTSLEHSSKATPPKSQALSGSKTNTVSARPKPVPPDFSKAETQCKTDATKFENRCHRIFPGSLQNLKKIQNRSKQTWNAMKI
jgi:hypothetical protein